MVSWLLEVWTLEGAEGPDDDGEYGSGSAGGGSSIGGGGGGEAAVYTEGLIVALAGGVGDPNCRVQTAACSALYNVASEAAELLSPHVSRLVPALAAAVGRYSTANRCLLYDSLGRLADEAPESLRGPGTVEALLPPLLARFEALRDLDAELPPLLECLGYLFIPLGRALAPIAQRVWARALSLVEHDCVLILAARAEAAGGPAGGAAHVTADADVPLASVALDAMGGIAEGCAEGGLLAAMLAGAPAACAGERLAEALALCALQAAPALRQSTFALVGELARAAPAALAPALPRLLPALLVSMRDAGVNAKACNNAVWALGCCAASAPLAQAVLPSAREAARRIGAVTCSERLPAPQRALLENAAIALGRLALVAPEAVAHELAAMPPAPSPAAKTLLHAWAESLTVVSDPAEREQAYLGLCAALRLNPQPGLALIARLAVAFAVFGPDRTPAVHAATAALLQAYHDNAPKEWAAEMTRLAPNARTQLASLYGGIFR